METEDAVIGVIKWPTYVWSQETFKFFIIFPPYKDDPSPEYEP